MFVRFCTKFGDTYGSSFKVRSLDFRDLARLDVLFKMELIGTTDIHSGFLYGVHNIFIASGFN